MAVLDAQCRVRGVDSLRVIDSSVFPTITNGNLNAPTIMVGEKAADILLGRDPPGALERRSLAGPRLANPAAPKPPMTARRSRRRR